MYKLTLWLLCGICSIDEYAGWTFHSRKRRKGRWWIDGEGVRDNAPMCGQVVRTAELLPGRSKFMDQQAPQWGKLNVNRFNQAKDKSDMSVKLGEQFFYPLPTPSRFQVYSSFIISKPYLSF